MSVNIVIPVKDSFHAKRRLTPVLGDEDRRKVTIFLCRRTLGFFRKYFPQEHLSVVTSSPEMTAIAESYGAAVIPETEVMGLSSAAQLAAEWSLAQGFKTQLIIPADIADLSVEEISHILNMAAPTPSVTICQSVDGRTHALMTTPPTAIPFAFGENSSWHHLYLARQRDIPCRLLRLPKLSYDIDTPADLAHFNQQRRIACVQ